MTICLGLRAPIKIGTYMVDGTKIDVSYPDYWNVGGTRLELPRGLSSLFTMRWFENKAVKPARQERTLKALDIINELLLAFALVRVGQLDGCGVRTVGLNDTLIYIISVDGQDIEVNVRLKNAYNFGTPAEDPFDATSMALPHIGTNTLPVARRYVRCHELLDHGFYSECAIVAFSIMDDLVQQMIDNSLSWRGMTSRSDRKDLIRGIKENRLKIFLGPLLMVLHNKTIGILWPESNNALTWLNELRNKIAHSGYKATYDDAVKSIFVCLKIIYLLNREGFIEAELNVELFRHSKFLAAHVCSPPPWVPTGPVAETMDFET